MMNRSKIEWCDFSWNPVTGCRHACSYCYARRQASRFSGDVRLNMTSPQCHGDKKKGLFVLEEPFQSGNSDRRIPMPFGFEPTLHTYRLEMPAQMRIPSNIFVGSMADLFGEWVPEEWINQVLHTCGAAPWHRYLFLTKNPMRYAQLHAAGRLPNVPSMWYGATITDPSMDTFWSEEHKTFLSIEPLLESFEGITPKSLTSFNWVIIGAETGQRRGKVTPRREWVQYLVNICKALGIPVFLKNNLAGVWGKDLIQEFPRELMATPYKDRPVHKVYVESVRDEKNCRECGIHLQGHPAWRISARFYVCEKCYQGVE